uniref:Immunoglobulin domain-containing protein n=1 Tax=Cyprinus carpio TaxID=7962 RepID=A0A8C2D140_CYPCA
MFLFVVSHYVPYLIHSSLMLCSLFVVFSRKILQQLLVCVSGVSAAERDEMKRKSVKEGETVTLDTYVINKPDNLMWHFNEIVITGDQCKICTDVQCEYSDERFRDRLKLDHQTGSLTITNITITDSGDYTLYIISSSFIQRTVSVTVTGVSAAERDEMKRKSVKEGETVTLDTYVINKPDNLMWHFNEIVITGDQCKICTDVQCEYSDERFRDRLKLDHQTGSLTITNITITDSGDYTLYIISSSFIQRTVSVTVTGESLCFKS